IEQLRATEIICNIPIVALTASTVRGSVERIKNRCDGYLMKPVSKYELFEELAKFLPHQRQVTEIEAVQEETIVLDEPLKAQLRALFLIKYLQIKEFMINSEIEDFSVALRKFAEKNDIVDLVNYANELSHYVNTFKIDKMSSKFLAFERFICKT
ncbi:MAG: hypothetical protein BWK79_16730, partial [Beggiatoa sp. IS2]